MSNFPRLSKNGNIVVKCKKCGNVFILRKDNLDFYRNRGLTPPKTCPTCLLFREARKNGLLCLIPEVRVFNVDISQIDEHAALREIDKMEAKRK